MTSALEKISAYIHNKKLKEMKQWSTRYRPKEKNWFMKKKVKQVRQILHLVSGGDIVEMLEDVLHKNEREALTLPKYKDALMNLSENYEKTPLAMRHQLIKPLKEANMKRKDLRDMGFPVSNELWKNCDEPRDEKQTRNIFVGLSQKVQDDLKKFLMSKSSLCPNSLVVEKTPDTSFCDKDDKNADEDRPVRYIEDSSAELYQEFFQKHDISVSTFTKYMRIIGNFRTSHRNTVGQCEHCDKENPLVNSMRKALKGEEALLAKLRVNPTLGTGFASTQQLDKNGPLELSAMCDLFKQQATSLWQSLEHGRFQLMEQRDQISKDFNKYKQFITDLNSYEAILFHKKLARCQRRAYVRQTQDVRFMRGKVLIDIDFKRLNITTKTTKKEAAAAAAAANNSATAAGAAGAAPPPPAAGNNIAANNNNNIANNLNMSGGVVNNNNSLNMSGNSLNMSGTTATTTTTNLNMSGTNMSMSGGGVAPRQQVSCLSFGVHYVDETTNEIRCINFDIFSNEFKQDAQAAINGFKLLKSQNFFKQIDTNDYVFWTNCGKHFRSKHFISFFLRELGEKKQHVNLNYFGDKHGESSRDSHFASINKFIQEELAVRTLESSDQILETVIRRQILINDKIQNVKLKQMTYGLTLDQTSIDFNDLYQSIVIGDPTLSKKTILIHNLESFYNYQTIGFDFKLATSVTSNTTRPNELIEMKQLNQGSMSNQIIYEVIPDSKTNESLVDIFGLEKFTKYYNILSKKQRILSAVRQIKVTQCGGQDAMIDYENDDNYGQLFSRDYFTFKPASELKAKEKTELNIEEFDFDFETL